MIYNLMVYVMLDIGLYIYIIICVMIYVMIYFYIDYLYLFMLWFVFMLIHIELINQLGSTATSSSSSCLQLGKHNILSWQHQLL